LEGSRGKREGIGIYEAAIWQSPDSKPPTPRLLAPEYLQKRRESWSAASEVFASLLGVVGDDEIVEESERLRQSRLYAASLMFADAWRCLVEMPRRQAEHTEATIKAIAQALGARLM
jgi:hypothetical protein